MREVEPILLGIVEGPASSLLFQCYRPPTLREWPGTMNPDGFLKRRRKYRIGPATPGHFRSKAFEESSKAQQGFACANQLTLKLPCKHGILKGCDDRCALAGSSKYNQALGLAGQYVLESMHRLRGNLTNVRMNPYIQVQCEYA